MIIHNSDPLPEPEQLQDRDGSLHIIWPTYKIESFPCYTNLCLLKICKPCSTVVLPEPESVPNLELLCLDRCVDLIVNKQIPTYKKLTELQCYASYVGLPKNVYKMKFYTYESYMENEYKNACNAFKLKITLNAHRHIKEIYLLAEI
jgi:hypothetical protein